MFMVSFADAALVTTTPKQLIKNLKYLRSMEKKATRKTRLKMEFQKKLMIQRNLQVGTSRLLRPAVEPPNRC